MKLTHGERTILQGNLIYLKCRLVSGLGGIFLYNFEYMKLNQ